MEKDIKEIIEWGFLVSLNFSPKGVIMQFSQCAKCGLSLPNSYLIPVLVNHNGKQVKVFLCERCKAQVEIKEKKNENN